jgi:mannose PTS system EIID component
MQNLGFVYSIMPLASEPGIKIEKTSFLARHLQLFNTHPYLSAAIIGSVARIEETGQSDPNESIQFKNTLMGPYAAIGDSFFGGALRSFCAVLGTLVAMNGNVMAPFVYLIAFNPAHLWIRIKGFTEGYRKGRDGIDFIKAMNLTRISTGIRWFSVVNLAIFASLMSNRYGASFPAGANLLARLVGFGFILTVFIAVRKGISQIMILYMTFLLILILLI